MKSNLAIATLIQSRMTELGLSRGEFAKRLGYKNIAKGIRRIDALCEGDITGEHSRLPDRLIKDRRPTISNKMDYPPSPWIEEHGLLNRHEQKHPSIG